MEFFSNSLTYTVPKVVLQHASANRDCWHAGSLSCYHTIIDAIPSEFARLSPGRNEKRLRLSAIGAHPDQTQQCIEHSNGIFQDGFNQKLSELAMTLPFLGTYPCKNICQHMHCCHETEFVQYEVNARSLLNTSCVIWNSLSALRQSLYSLHCVSLSVNNPSCGGTPSVTFPASAS